MMAAARRKPKATVKAKVPPKPVRSQRTFARLRAAGIAPAKARNIANTPPKRGTK